MLRKVRARKFAVGLLKEFEIKQAPVDVESIVKTLPKKFIEQLEVSNLEILKQNFPNDLGDVSAILLKEKGQAIIAVNAAHTDYRQRFSIAHELGHLILHSSSEHLTVEKEVERQFFTRAEGVHGLDEMEANEFAAALLMPEELIKEDFEKYFQTFEDEIISNLATKYKVSQAALTYRLKNLGLL